MPIVTFTCDDELKARLEREAKNERRSLSKQVEYIIHLFFSGLRSTYANSATGVPSVSSGQEEGHPSPTEEL